MVLFISEEMKQIPSPRILATHLNYDCLPKSIFKNKAKVGFFLFLRTSLISLTVPACKSDFGTTSFSCTQAGRTGGKQLGDNGSLMMPMLA